MAGSGEFRGRSLHVDIYPVVARLRPKVVKTEYAGQSALLTQK